MQKMKDKQVGKYVDSITVLVCLLFYCLCILTLILLTWRKWWTP